ncbi:MAG: xanthine dehydrogenase family protein molybdopterin-binding subunit, partial [Armatimonadota bacterium]|nr:xanthine dehydrogenase family protein molybdopterin-binding subunit [Armatimonadota bacterium]
DLLARDLGLDPYHFRRLNALREGDVSPTGLRWENIRALEVLEEAARRGHWGEPLPGPFRGRGIALTERSVGLGGSAALVMLQRDGSATVVTGATDPGTGSRTVLRQIAARELQLPLARVGLGEGDTSLAPYDNGSGSSRVTHVAGQAVRLAAQDALRQAREMAAARLGVEPAELTYEDGVFRAGGGSLTLAEVLRAGGRQGNVVVGRGSYVAEKGSHTCFCAQVAQVQVDPETGQVRVERLVTVNDIGVVLHPQAASGQAEGAVVQGLGFALQEELPRPGGRPQVLGLADYKLPTAPDAPEVEVHLLEGGLGPGPYGAKSIGEQPIAATAPAVVNAVRAALGIDLWELPVTPERVRRAWREKQGEV